MRNETWLTGGGKIAQRDLYAVLELAPGAAAFDVKAAYRKLARKWHPDKNPDDVQARGRIVG